MTKPYPGSRRFQVDVSEVVYRRDDQVALQGRLFQPRGRGPFPAAVDVHGGAWVQGDRTGNDPINVRLAQRGIVVLAVDHRLGPAAAHPAAVQDVNYAVRWLKVNALRLNTLSACVGISGTSAGGHLAMLTALKALDPRYASLSLEGDCDAQVAFAVGLWPVVCPLRRYREVVLSGAQNPFPDRPAGTTRQMAYWQSEAAMLDASPLDVVARGERISMPPMLIVQSASDPLHPIAHAREFVERYANRGGAAHLHIVDGEPYYLVRSEPDSRVAQAAMDHIAQFMGESLPFEER